MVVMIAVDLFDEGFGLGVVVVVGRRGAQSWC